MSGEQLMVVMGEVTPEGGTVITDMRDATPDDVVAWLTEHGADTYEVPAEADKWVEPWRLALDPGRYLVYKLPE